MDTQLAAERMKKFGIIAKNMMPEILIFSTTSAIGPAYVVASGGKLTKENTDAALMALVAIQKREGWL